MKTARTWPRFSLMLTFMKIGAFTFGGGYALISAMRNECVDKKKWITGEEFANIAAISETTPGPIAINCATFTGYRQAGVSGAAVATLGIVLPSFAIIFLVSMFLDNMLEIAVIANAFKGVRIGVGVLILTVAVKMLRNMPKKALPVLITIFAFVASLLINLLGLNFSGIYLVLISGAVGYLAFVVGHMKRASGHGGRS